MLPPTLKERDEIKDALDQERRASAARWSFEYLLELDSPELAEWFGNGGVTDYLPIFIALKAARAAGVKEAAELLNNWKYDYAEQRT